MSTSSIDEILNHLHELQVELENEIDRLLHEKSERFRYHLEKGRVRFEQGMRVLQRHHRVDVWSYLRAARIGHILTAPVVYSLVIPFLLLDLMVTIYQFVCFHLYGIARVQRSDYLIIDRQHLVYLNAIEKLNCVFCGYANGVIEYVREVAARTEQYWCPVKHARRSPEPHRLVQQFIDYGDADAYKSRLSVIRKKINDKKNV